MPPETLDCQRRKGDPDNIAQHLVRCIKGFSSNVRRTFEFFEFDAEIEKMHEANVLYLVVAKFADVDLHPSNVHGEGCRLRIGELVTGRSGKAIRGCVHAVAGNAWEKLDSAQASRGRCGSGERT